MTYRKKDGNERRAQPHARQRCGDKSDLPGSYGRRRRRYRLHDYVSAISALHKLLAEPVRQYTRADGQPGQTPKAIGQEVVSDNANDLNVTFPFNATINVDGATINSDSGEILLDQVVICLSLNRYALQPLRDVWTRRPTVPPCDW